MSEKIPKVFIGEKRVKEIRDTDKRTPGNAMVHEVEFENGTVELIPHERLILLQTDHVSTATNCREKLVSKLGTAMFGYMHEFDLTMEEIDPVLNEIVRLGNAGAEKASNCLWKVEHAHMRSLLMINRVLVENLDVPKKPDNNDAAPTSGGVADQPNSDTV